jgi:hypothetical protein
MKTKIDLEKTRKMRGSMPEILTKGLLLDLYDEDKENPELTFRQRFNKKMNQYKEIKTFCKLTHIEPFFYSIIISILLIFVIVGFFDNYITIILATFYPLYMSFKALKFKIGEEKPDGTIYDDEDEKNDIIRWLCYWICYSVLINIESIFRSLLKKVPLYFFFKIVFLLLCFLPHCQFSSYVYDNYIKRFFAKYEKKIVDVSSTIVRKFTEKDDEEEEKRAILKMNKSMIDIRRKKDEDFEKEMENYIK